MVKVAMKMRTLCGTILAAAVVFSAFAEREYIWPEGKMPDAQDHQSAWEDGQRAVRMVRSEAAKREVRLNIRPKCVILHALCQKV